jgi:sugar lactone lactonase YvrE
VNEIQAVGGSIPASPTVKTLTSQFVSPAGIAVDGSGNVYVLDASNNTVNEIFAVNGSIPAVPTITTLASGFKQLNGIAVDNNGNVYVSDDTSREVFEIHAINGSIPASPLITSLGSGFVFPRGIAVDVIGNVYVAEYSYNTVYEILAVNGSIPASPTIQTLGTGLVYANGVAIDGNRNVIVADYGDARIVRLDYADPPSLSFASTTVGSISTDSPQTTTIENVGNAALSFPASSVGSNPSIAADFTLDSSGTSACPLISADSATPGVLAAGASCQLPISFFPTKAGALSGSLVLTDNDLNASAPVFTAQSIMLSGTGTQATPTITWASPAAITYGTLLSPTQLNATSTVAGTFTYSPAAGTILGVGSQTLTVAFTPTDSADYTTAKATVTLTVNPAPSFTIGASPASLSVTQGANGTSTITVTPLNGFTGSVSLSASGLPSGVTAAFSTNPTTKTSVLTLTASSTAATGLATITVAGTSGSLTATTPITLTVIAKPGFACHVGYTITNHWQGGFGAAITINNTGTTAIKSWTLKWSFANGQTITQIWNGTETQSGANITATSMSYNGSIPAGGSYTGMGFNGSWNNSTNAIPASFSINGTTCK